MKKKILIVGATSAIAEATARLFAKKGDELYLVGRNEDRLDALAKDLRIRGASLVRYSTLDVNDFSRHVPVLDAVVREMDGIDLVLVAHGTLGDQRHCEKSPQLTLQELNTNMVSTILLLTYLANYFEAQGGGTIAVLSSVAGDRGRQSNYVYGAAKGGLSVFLQGLRNRMHKYGVQVLTIKPGFVDSPMTASFQKGPLWSSPEAIAAGIKHAIERKRSEVYLPGWWRIVMLVIRSIPEKIFKSLSL